MSQHAPGTGLLTLGPGLRELGDGVLAQHPGLASRLSVLHLEAAEGSSDRRRSALRLPLPTSAALLEHLAATWRRDETSTLTELLPPAWQGGPDTWPSELDPRYRARHALLNSRRVLDRRLDELVAAKPSRIVVVAQGHEPTASGGLLLVAGWLRERLAEAEHAIPIDLVLGLEPLGAAASSHPADAARLVALLSGLDRAESHFEQVVLVGSERLQAETLTTAMVELVGRLLRLHLDDPDPTPPATASFRARPTRYVAATAGTATLDLASVADAHCRRLAPELRAVVVSREDVEAFDPGALARSRIEEIETGIAASLRELESWRHRHAERGRRATGLEDLTARALETARSFLTGGTIDRMTGKVQAGYVARHLEWCWQLVVGGRAGLDDVLTLFQVLALGLPASHSERELDERRRALAEAPEDPLRQVDAALAEVRHAWARAFHEDLEGVTRSAAQVRGHLVGLAELCTKTTTASARESPWRSVLPLSPEEVSRSLRESGVTALGWLQSSLDPGSVDPARALSRPAEVLERGLRDDIDRRLHELLERHPVAELPGLRRWLPRFIAGLPPLTTVDHDALPRRQAHRRRCVLHAETTDAAGLAGSLGQAPELRSGDDAASLGWIELVGPFPLQAWSELAAARQAASELLSTGRIAPLPEEHAGERFHDPLPGDLVTRGFRQLGSEAGGRWRESFERVDDLLPSELAGLPRDRPALRVLTTVASWTRGWATGESPSLPPSLGRDLQELSELREHDGSDDELHELLERLAPVARAVQVATEVTSAGDQVHHLTTARQALDEARTRIDLGLAGRERRVFTRLLDGWTSGLDERLRALRGRSELGLDLRTRRAISTGRTTLRVELVNRGEHPALRASVSLMASEHFRVLGPDRLEVGELGPGRRQALDFSIKPSAEGELPIALALSWDDLESTGKTARQDERVTIIAQPPAFRRIEKNPYIAGPPVRSTEMFFGRQDVFRHVTDNLTGRHQDNVLILFGRRRTGKSSILYQLERGDLLEEHLAVLVDLQGLGGFDTASLLYQLARKLGRRLRSEEGGSELPRPQRSEFSEAPYDAFQDHLDDIEDLLVGLDRRLLVMIDEFELLRSRVEAGAVEPEIFPFLRNLMQHRERLAFLLAGTNELVTMREDYSSILFSLAIYRRISYLPTDDAGRLIEEPVRGELLFDDLLVDSLLHLTAGHPYYLQLTCQNLVNHANLRNTHGWLSPEDLQSVLPEVLEAGEGHFLHEWRSLESQSERCALAAIAENDDTGLRWFETAEVTSLVQPVHQRSFPAEDEVLQEALEQLHRADLLEADEARRSWRVRIDLMRHWIRRNRSLERAAAGGSTG
ncbi:MAG: ATP-binding protein [Acidobacteriota bacterium]